MRRFGIIREASEGGKESFTLRRNGVQLEAKRCSRCGEMRVQIGAKSVFIFARNTQLCITVKMNAVFA
jgi:hypothetical protein